LERHVNGGRCSPRQKLLFKYTLDGDLRFISHHDTVRLFQRALTRAALPVRFTEGFNPHAKMQLPVPRPVGVASQDEALIVEFEQTLVPADACRRLAAQLPPDLQLLGAQVVQVGQSIQPEAVHYRLTALPPAKVDLPQRVRQVLESDVVQVERQDPKTRDRRVLDIRPYVQDLRVVEGAVEFTLRLTAHGSARPAEIAQVLGYNADSINHRIRRMEIRWLPKQTPRTG